MGGDATRLRGGGVGQRVRRLIGDVGMTIGMSGGLTWRGQPADTHLRNRALIEEGRRPYAERPSKTAPIDRIPGWIVLALLGLVLVVALFVWEWQ